MNDNLVEKIYNRFHNDVAGFCTAFTNIFYDVSGNKQEIYPLQLEFMNLSKPSDRIVSVIKCRQCVPGDTLVYTENGPEHIETLYTKNYRGNVFSFDGNSSELLPVEDVWQTGYKELYSIRLASGEEVKCTGDHKIYVEGQWKRADEIKIGDILTTFEGNFGADEILDEEVIAMGYFITDGTYTNASPKFTNNNMKYINEFANCVNKLFNVLTRIKPKQNGFDCSVVGHKGRNGRNKSEYAQYLIDLGMRDVKGRERILPDKFMNLNKRQTALLLNRIFAGDGWYASCGTNRTNEVGIGSPSLKFLYQISFLLSKFGIHCYVSKQKGYVNDFYKLKFSSFEYIEIFKNEIDIYDKYPRSDIKKINNSKKSKFRVKKIEKLDGLHQTYDMTVAKNHNYYANGILVHNSGFTTSIKAKALHNAFFGKVPNFLIASASQLQATKVLREIKEAIYSMPEFIRPEFSKETETEIHFTSGSKLVSLPANPQTVRGFSGSVALDEFGVLNRKDSEELYEALLPTLVKGYNMVIVSTPRGKDNLFHDLCNPKFDNDGNIVGVRADKIIKVHWTEVPHVRKAVEEMDLQNKMSRKSFLQEFCCEFVEDEDSSLFELQLINDKFIDRTIGFVDASFIDMIEGDSISSDVINYDLKKVYQYIYVGFDPAISGDGSCVTVWGVKNDEWKHLFLKILPKGMEVGPQCDYVSRLAQFFCANKIGIDSTGGMGLAFLSRMKETVCANIMLPITFSTNFKTKEYAEIKNKMESHRMKSPENHEMAKQFTNLGYNPVTGRIAALGSWRTNHDDIPSAILCAHACRSKTNNSGFSFI
jgi:intein/homing endonuclease